MTSMTVTRIKYALATAGVIGAVGAVSVASAASPKRADNVAPPTSGYSKDQCKKGSWQALGFRNQGQCVSFFAKQQH
jgi:hypothetical protein